MAANRGDRPDRIKPDSDHTAYRMWIQVVTEDRHSREGENPEPAPSEGRGLPHAVL
jgi:hypothetical protein